MIKRRVRRVILIALLVLVLLFSEACVHSYRHAPGSAATSATQFLTAALVSKDLRGAYGQLDPSTKAQNTESAFERSTSAVPGFGKVDHIIATGYDPMPGQRAMRIYLKGTGSEQTYYYILEMAGLAETGYRPLHFAVTYGPVTPGPAGHALP